jgi:putative ABC transport system substrate-binding protein
MRRRKFIGLIGGAAAWPLAARAQQSKKVPLIGVLYQGESAERQPDYTWLREGFKAVGYVEGINVIFEERYLANNLEKADLLAKELVDLKCDVLIGVTVTAAAALRRHTSTIPIVFVYNSRPVESGLVKSLNRPGGNVTGVTQIGIDTAAKRSGTAQRYYSRIVKRGPDLGPVPCNSIHHQCRAGGDPNSGEPAWTVICIVGMRQSGAS